MRGFLSLPAPLTTPDSPVSVVVATRNRGASITRTLRSILANDHPRFDVTIIDQSDDDRTLAAVTPFLPDARVRYRRTATVGLARAHNLAIVAAPAELVALTDDDCEVPAGWLAAFVSAFAVDARVGVVFGNVLPADAGADAGFVPAYVRAEAFLARSLRHKVHVDGIGACMGVRRSVWAQLGGFDERFGAGARFLAANEGDLTMRALAAGWFVYETPQLWVVHYGFRDREDGRALVRRYAFGTGAMMAKHMRCGTPHTAPLLMRMAWRWMSGKIHRAARLDGWPHRLLRLAAFARGFAAGAVASVEA